MEEKKEKLLKPNPYNHPLIQALLDIKRVLLAEGYDTLNDIDDILDEFMDEGNIELRERGNAIWQSHRYPDKSLKFIMSLTYDKCPERYALSLEEQAILGLMEHIQCQTTGGVIVKKKEFVDILNFTNTQRKRLQQNLDHLTECGFLKCIHKPIKGSKRPGIYLVNRKMSWIGCRDQTESPFSVNVPSFEKKYKQTSESVVLPDGKKLNCGTISEYIPTQPPQKKGTATDQNDNSPAESAPKDSF